MSILAVIIGNVITILLAVIIIYVTYKSNKDKVDEFVEKIEAKIDEVEDIVSDIDSTINKIDESLEKFSVNTQNE